MSELIADMDSALVDLRATAEATILHGDQAEQDAARDFIAMFQRARNRIAELAEVQRVIDQLGRLCTDNASAALSLSRALAAAKQEAAGLHERLEDNFAWKIIDGEEVRIPHEPGSIPDGIASRDTHINLLDRRLHEEARRADNAERDLAAARLALQAADREWYGKLLAADAELVSARLAAGQAQSALAELVACKDLRLKMAPLQAKSGDGMTDAEWTQLDLLQQEYARRQPKAWDDARIALASGTRAEGR